jgi:two-component system sensor histidine kinase KdpD
MSVAEARPDPTVLLRRLDEEARRRASLRLYLQYAVGAGATTAMLDEARRRTQRGTDVVVAAYRLHDPPEEALKGLEVLGGHQAAGTRLRLDLDRLLARNPEVACIDDVAAPDLEGRPIYEEAIPRLLGAGVTVLGTLHLLSLRDLAAGFREAARRQRISVVDDALLAHVDELELVDVPPEDLVERLRAGRVLSPAELAVALQGELRKDVLVVLREAAFRVIAQQADRQLVGYLKEGALSPCCEARALVVLAIPARPCLEDRIRAVAQRAAALDAGFHVVTVRRSRLKREQGSWLGAYATLVHQLGGEFRVLDGRAVAPTLAAYVREVMATEIVLGHPRRSRWRPGNPISRLIRLLSGVDVHVLRAVASQWS